MAKQVQYQVGPDMVVEFDYELYDAEGELVEASDGAECIQFLWGYGQAAPSLELALAGLVPGQTRRVPLRAEEAFGPRDEEAVIHVDRGEFPSDIAVGQEFEAEADNGDVVPLRVLEVTEDSVVLDTNHALAGQQVELSVTVLSVRPATAEEGAVAAAQLLSRQTASQDVLLPTARLLRRDPSTGD